MPRRRKRNKRRWYHRVLGSRYLDEAAQVAAVAGGSAAGLQLLTYLPKDVKSSYLKNINSLARRRIKVPSKQFSFNFEGGKKVGKLQSVPLINKSTASTLKSRINTNFREGKGGKFRFFDDSKKIFRGIKNPYYSKSGKQLGLSSDIMNKLRLSNRRSLKKILPGRIGKILLYGSALGLPALARASQAKYSRKRKFKKEIKRSVRRGVVNPVKGAFYGKSLDAILKKYPALRGSRSIRQAEGRYAQMYGQGVQFYKGTSGMRSEDIQKLNTALAERRRLAKRRRGK